MIGRSYITLSAVAGRVKLSKIQVASMQKENHEEEEKEPLTSLYTKDSWSI